MLQNELNGITNLEQFNKLFGTDVTLRAYIGPWGGRRIVRYYGTTMHLNQGSLCINDLVKKVAALAPHATAPEKIHEALSNIDTLDRTASVILYYRSTLLQRILTFIKKIFGNFGFDRNSVIQTLRRQHPLPPPPEPLSAAFPAHAAASPLIEAPLNIPPLSEEAITFLDNNPYIHGGSSSIFAIFPHTGHRLLSLKDILFAGFAPISGEIEGGGTEGLMCESQTAFGCIRGTGYPLARVANYAHPIDEKHAQGGEQAKAQLAYCLGAIQECQLTKALLYVTRARQAGVPALEKSPELAKFIKEQKRIIINYYAACLLISKFATGSLRGDNFQGFIQELHQLLNEKNIDLQNYVFEETLRLECPELEALCATVGIQLQKVARRGPPAEESTGEITWARICVANAESMLIKALEHPTTVKGYVTEMETVFPSFFAEIEQVFQKIEERLFTNEGITVIQPPKNSFGVIFMCDSAHRSLFKPVKTECRATAPLTLGVEITKIATEAIHIPEVQAYLRQHGILNVEVLPLERVKERYLTP